MSRFSDKTEDSTENDADQDPMTSALASIDRSQSEVRRGRPTNAAIDNAKRVAKKQGWNAMMGSGAPHAMGRRRQVIPTAQVTLRVRPEYLQAFLNYCADENITQGAGFERLIGTLPQEFFTPEFVEER